MDLDQAVRKFRAGFKHPRTFSSSRPELPPGYNWERQIEKYGANPFKFTSKEKSVYPGEDYTNPEFHRTGRKIFMGGPRDHYSQNYNILSTVFCHRGFYDRAMKCPENSRNAIHGGIIQNLRHHELDVRLGKHQGEAFLAHDEVAGRVTSKAERWSSLSFNDIVNTYLVSRRIDLEKLDFASSYLHAGEYVPDLEKILGFYEHYNEYLDSLDEAGEKRPDAETMLTIDDPRDRYIECTFQLDLRGNDFPRMLAWFRYKTTRMTMIFKGYNLNFSSGQELKDAVSESPVGSSIAPWQNERSTGFSSEIIIVFYSQPILKLALRKKGFDPDKASPMEHSSLSYQDLYDTTWAHICSFLDTRIEWYPRMIPEIVHSGLGLGYDIATGKAVNPEDGSDINDPEVVMESCLDRVMIEVSLQLRQKYPQMIFSSCTRLCEVRTPQGEELVADMKTGRLKRKPDGEKGISARLRSIHGGLYPQSDTVVADDPFAEIAARTWIDEYARLDRAELLRKRISYKDWLAQAGEEVVRAVNKLNGPFLPNTFDAPLEGNWNMK